MSADLIDLTKKVQVVLDLRKISGEVKAAVGLCIDGSGSMGSLYARGVVQNVVNRIMAVACKFDDNQELDVWVFSNGVKEAEPAVPAMFGTYVQDELLRKSLVDMGGTEYAPFIRSVIQKYFTANGATKAKEAAKSIFGALKSIFTSDAPASTPAPQATGSVAACGYPVFIIVITDGENSDQGVTAGLLQSMQDKDVYWQFVGIGNENFRYLQNIADKLPNVGFFAIKDIEAVKDMELYKELVSEEFAAWINKFK